MSIKIFQIPHFYLGHLATMILKIQEVFFRVCFLKYEINKEGVELTIYPEILAFTNSQRY